MQVVISGYGKMGKMVEAVLKERSITCAAVSEDIRAVDPAIAAESVCIDFTTPTAIRDNYQWLAEHFKAVVIGTTGWNDIKPQVIECFEHHGTPMVYASNFSIGVNLLFGAVEYLSRKMSMTGGYRPSITEIHHVHKLDAPSGTAKTLAEIVEHEMGVMPEITSERIGEVPGTHTVRYDGSVDNITITHEAYSRKGFAEGAVEAAIKADSISGVHDFKDIIFEK